MTNIFTHYGKSLKSKKPIKINYLGSFLACLNSFLTALNQNLAPDFGYKNGCSTVNPTSGASRLPREELRIDPRRG
jgi:hypothetical protein